jgi:probable HAF family extracellular repeat protein
LPGGTQSQANAGSLVGIVGWATHSDTVHHAVAFSGGQAHALQEPPGATSSEASGLNAQGVIVGFATVGDTLRALLWPSATAAPVQLPGFGGAYSLAQSINDDNVVLGAAQDLAGDTVVVTWQPTAGSYGVTRIVARPDSASPADTVGQDYAPTGINDHGQIAGNLPSDPGETSGFFWSKEALDTIEAPTGGTTDANGINNLGMVVGSFDTPAGSRGFLYTNALGAFGVAPPPAGYSSLELNSVSDSGRVAGNAFTATNDTVTKSIAVTGTALDSIHTFTTLPTLGGNFAQPVDNAITTCGVILGWASRGTTNTPRYAVAWVPQGCTIP